MERVSAPRIEVTVEREAGKQAERVQVLDTELVRIGSHPSNDVTLGDPLVSRFHCRLTRTGRGWRLTDTGSRNGLRVGGVRVRDGDLLQPETRVELGDSSLRVRELAPVGEQEVLGLPSFGAIYSVSLPMQKLFARLERVAKSDASVLIEGESGTGKELVAGEIARRSSRADKPFVIVDCSAISRSLIESELFGHLKGAFTSAERDRVGAFEAANGGTVFLDEIGELPLDMQPKLLRVLEAREVRRLGDSRVRKVDVRVLAATNRDLEEEVNRGTFREDLYFRLSVVSIRVPPLREHPEDIRLLIQVFLENLDAMDSFRLFTPELIAELGRHRWPGNVRELRNYVERAVIFDAADPPRRGEGRPGGAPLPDDEVDLKVPLKLARERVLSRFEQGYLGALLDQTGGNLSQAARLAGVDRMYLHRLVQKHGIKSSKLLKD